MKVSSINGVFAWLYREAFIFQLIMYAGALFGLLYQTSLASLLFARFGHWHLLVLILWLVIFVYFRLQYPRTLRGTLLSIAVPLMAGAIGEFFICIWIWIYYSLCVQASTVFWYSFELGGIAFVCVLAGVIREIKWDRIVIGLVMLNGYVSGWMMLDQFHLSIGNCYPQLQYYMEPVTNMIEVSYWAFFFIIYLWAVNPHS